MLLTIRKRVVRHLIKQEYLRKEDGEPNPQNEVSEDNSLLPNCQGASIHYRLATGDRMGQCVRRVGSFGEYADSPALNGPRCATLAGFSLHANTGIKTRDRERLEQLCRYIMRPPIAEARLHRSFDGNIVYRFKREWSDGSKAILLSPLEFIEKLVALVPTPRRHLTRFHGVLAPHHAWRYKIVPTTALGKVQQKPEAPNPHRLKWAELLKRVFQVDITVCSDCGGPLRFIAAILDRETVSHILGRLGLPREPPVALPARAPPSLSIYSETF